jgi:hypothetical protein
VYLARFTKHLERLEWEEQSNPSNKSNKRNTNHPLKSLSTWFDFRAWRGFDALIVSWSVCFCSSIEWEGWKAWMAWMEVVGGIYSIQPLPSHLLTLLLMGTPDSSVVHWTLYCSLSGECHVSRPLGFGAVDRWNPLSSCGTGQFSVFWLCRLALTFTVRLYCSRPLMKLTLLRWLTGQSGGAPDSPMNYRGRTLRKPRAASSWRAVAWALDSVWCTADSVRCATGYANSCMLHTL